MVYFVIALIIIFFVVSMLFKSSTPLGFSREIAKTMLSSYNLLKVKYPNYDKEKMYTEVLKTRPGYSEEDAKHILDTLGDNEKNFRTFVHMLVIIEFKKRLNIIRIDDIKTVTDLAVGVREVISEDI